MLEGHKVGAMDAVATLGPLRSIAGRGRAALAALKAVMAMAIGVTLGLRGSIPGTLCSNSATACSSDRPWGGAPCCFCWSRLSS